MNVLKRGGLAGGAESAKGEWSRGSGDVGNWALRRSRGSGRLRTKIPRRSALSIDFDFDFDFETDTDFDFETDCPVRCSPSAVIRGSNCPIPTDRDGPAIDCPLASGFRLPGRTVLLHTPVARSIV